MDSQNNAVNNADLVHQTSQLLNGAEWFLDYRLKAFNLLNNLKAPEIERLDYSTWNLFERSGIEGNKRELLNIDESAENKASYDFIQNSSGKFKEFSKADDSILVADFRDLFNQENELFKKYYVNSEFLNFKDSFNAFNLAFLTSGIFIHIPKGMNVKDPIKIEFLDNVLGASRNHQVFIYAEENSSVEIIESYSSLENREKSNKLNVHVHIQASAGAIIKYTAIDELNKNTKAFFRRTARVDRDATVELALGIMNNGHTIEDVQVDLLGDGSAADVKSVAIGHSDQVQCVNTKVLNHGSHTVGNIYQHGAVLDQATLTFNGIGDVLKNAKHSDAQQESRILILSDEARADTNPLLLIDEYELTAGHAASISRVDEDQLYYLMSRGLGKKQAEKLVIRGFLGSVLSAISVKEVRDKLIETIERKLSAL